ncbi:MAG: DNA repair protein RadA [bacterium]
MFVCSECGYSSHDWMGRCPNCNQFDTFEEDSGEADDSSGETAPLNEDSETLSDISTEKQSRFPTGLSELDRVLGGGMVPGSVALIGGPPGIGKSTLLLQWADSWPVDDGPVLYINGEESKQQVARRARRINSLSDNVELIPVELIESLTAKIDQWDPSLVFVDSIQTVRSEESNGSPGSVSQLRAVTRELVDTAKKRNIPHVLVGHVTKEGKIGGPKRLEHMVDTVLYFDDSDRGYRFVRSAKNRFGPTGELGIFEMTESGLNPIENPGEYFCSTDGRSSGRALTVALQGTRALMVEVQALVTPSQYGTPQRTATGLPEKRLKMMVAVLEKKLGLPLGTQDIILNVAGGLTLDDPGTDLAAVLSIISSFHDSTLPQRLVGLAELGLTGRLRAPAQIDRRKREAIQLQSEPIVVGGNHDTSDSDSVIGVETLSELSNTLGLKQP